MIDVITLSNLGSIIGNPTSQAEVAIPAAYNARYFGEKGRLKVYSWQYTPIPQWTENVKPPEDYGVDNFVIIEDEIDVVTLYCDSVSWNDDGIEKMSYEEIISLLKTRDTSGNGSKEFPFKNLSYALAKIACMRQAYYSCPICMPTIHLCVSGIVDYSAMIYPLDMGVDGEFTYSSVSANGSQFDFDGKLIIDGCGTLEIKWEREVPLFNVHNTRFCNMDIAIYKTDTFNYGYYYKGSNVFDFYQMNILTNADIAFNQSGFLNCNITGIKSDKIARIPVDCVAKCSFRNIAPASEIIFNSECAGVWDRSLPVFAQVIIKSTFEFNITEPLTDGYGGVLYMITDMHSGDPESICADVSVRIAYTGGDEYGAYLGAIKTTNCIACTVEVVDETNNKCGGLIRIEGINAGECLACDIAIKPVCAYKIFGISAPNVKWNTVTMQGGLLYTGLCNAYGIYYGEVVTNNSVVMNLYPAEKCDPNHNDNSALYDHSAYGYLIEEAGGIINNNSSSITLGDGETKRLLTASGFFIQNNRCNEDNVTTQIVNCTSVITLRGACAYYGKSFDANCPDYIELINSHGNDVCNKGGGDSCNIEINCEEE